MSSVKSCASVSCQTLLMFFYSSDMVISPSTISTSEDFNVIVTVHNTGAVAGKEVVQVSCE